MFSFDRIKAMSKVSALHDQLEPMHALVGQLKKDKDSANKKINSLEKEMDGVLKKIQVTDAKYLVSNASSQGMLRALTLTFVIDLDLCPCPHFYRRHK